MNRIAPACSGECTGAIRNAAGSGVTGGESAAFTSLNLSAAAWTDTPDSYCHVLPRDCAEAQGGDRTVPGHSQPENMEPVLKPGPQLFSQRGIHRSKRANARGPVEVPAEFVTALAEPIFVHVDVEYPIPDTLDQIINPLPITAAHPCPYCGRYPGHHDWCGRPNVRVSFHPRKLIGLDGTWHATGSEA